MALGTADAAGVPWVKLDGRIAMSKQYETTMLWSRALHRWVPVRSRPAS